MDFKAQLMQDMAVFHNPGEFATMTKIWYDGELYEVPVILDSEKAKEVQQAKRDYYHAEGIYAVEKVVYIAHTDLGFVPKKGHSFEIDVVGAIETYTILKSDYEDGEIILELGAFEE